jgi:cyclic beta-1,2-glucan synthetase
MAIPSFKLFDYLKAQELLSRGATRQGSTSRGKDSFSDAAEWMPDNFYLVQQTGRQICEDIPAGFCRQLPKITAGTLKGYLRIYAIAQELVVTSGTDLDIDQVKRFVHLYQDLTPLRIGELWALPVMLRLPRGEQSV